MIEILAKSFAVGLVVALILSLGRADALNLSGLAAWVPAVTIAGLLFITVGDQTNDSGRTFLRYSMLAVPVWFAFAAVTYVSLGRLSLGISIGLGLVAWIAAAAVFSLVTS